MDSEKWIDSKDGIVFLEFEEIRKTFSVPLISDDDIKQEKSTPEESENSKKFENSKTDYEVIIEKDEPMSKNIKYEETTDFAYVRKFQDLIF